MTRFNSFFATAAFLLLAAGIPLLAAETNDVLSQIEKMVSLGEERDSDRTLGESIRDGIESNPVKMSETLVVKLADKALTEQQQGVYVWALGLTKEPSAVDTIETLFKQSKSAWVKANCLAALTAIGGQQAGALLLSVLDEKTEAEARFDILNALGEMHHEAALPKAEELLKKDPDTLYWQPIFFFAKMGDKAIPFLLTKINDKDRNIRANAVNVLGSWLIPLEAAKPLQEQFWKEQDKDMRGLILQSVVQTTPDIKQLKIFLDQVAAKEKDEALLKHVRDALKAMATVQDTARAYAKKKQPSATAFQSQYTVLFKSAGKKGSYESLGISSTVQDEAKLKALRERILQRNSDEAFYDYQKVNDVISRNRMLKAMEDGNKAQPRS